MIKNKNFKSWMNNIDMDIDEIRIIERNCREIYDRFELERILIRLKEGK